VQRGTFKKKKKSGVEMYLKGGKKKKYN